MPEISLNIEKTEYKNINPPFKDDTLPPEQMKEIIMEGKKRTRRERYENSTEELNIPFFKELERYQLLTCKETVSNNGKSKNNYTGQFVWNTQGLNEIPLDEEIDKDALIQFLNPKKDITHNDAEDLLSSSPNMLVASMTLLTNSYEWATTKLRTKVYKRQFNRDPRLLKDPNYYFLKKEEVIFLTGRTLLVELNKVYQDEYVEQLISRTDGLIHNFNRGLIGKGVKKYLNSELPTKDLFSAGCEGLLKGLKKYDIDTGNKFSTYTYWWIRQTISRYVADNYSKIRNPVHMHDAINRFLRALYKLQQENDGDVTLEETIAYCEENNIKLPSDKKLLLRAYRQRNIESLDREINTYSDDNRTVGDYVPDNTFNPEEIASESETTKILEHLINIAGLTPREERIVKLRYGAISEKKDRSPGHTLEEVGNMEGVTKERVRQIQAVAMRKLQKAAKGKNFLIAL
jgi:RNA polymerase primary sigma factor